MNLLIAVRSSIPELQAGKHDNIRESWLKGVNHRAQVYFFNGDPFVNYGRAFIKRVKDEVHIPGLKDTPGDAYADALKTRGVLRWMLGKTFSHVLILDTATYIDLDRFFALHLERYDYAGFATLNGSGFAKGETFEYVNPAGVYHQRAFAWAASDRGIFLSRDAVTELTENVALTPYDFHIGQTLGVPIFRAHLKAADVDMPTWHMPDVKFAPIYDAGGPTGPTPVVEAVAEHVNASVSIAKIAEQILPAPEPVVAPDYEKEERQAIQEEGNIIVAQAVAGRELPPPGLSDAEYEGWAVERAAREAADVKFSDGEVVWNKEADVDKAFKISPAIDAPGFELEKPNAVDGNDVNNTDERGTLGTVGERPNQDGVVK